MLCPRQSDRPNILLLICTIINSSQQKDVVPSPYMQYLWREVGAFYVITYMKPMSKLSIIFHILDIVVHVFIIILLQEREPCEKWLVYVIFLACTDSILFYYFMLGYKICGFCGLRYCVSKTIGSTFESHGGYMFFIIF